MQGEIKNYIEKIPHFGMLPEHERQKLAQQAVFKTFAQGAVLAEQEKTVIKHIYVIRKGQISLYNEESGRREVGGHIKSGEVFGGITLLMNGGMSLRTVRADRDTDAYMIPQALFLDLCARYKDFFNFFVENYSKHIYDPALLALVASGQAKTFLSGIAPFSFLPEAVLEEATSNLSMVHHREGAILFRQAMARVGHLYILQKGTAERYYDQDGQKTMRDILAEGDIYGGISMLVNDGISVRTLEVTEDTYFYILPKKYFMLLCESHREFSEFFTDTFGKRMLDKTYSAIIARTATPPQEELQLYNQSVRQLYSADPVFGSPGITIRQAAQKMREENSTYVIIPASKTHAAGIITDSDLARKVIASGYDIRRSVVEVMSTPLRSIGAEAMVFEALMAMMQYDIKHLAVTDEEKQIVGVLSHRELLSAQGHSPIFLVRNMSRADTLDDIVEQQQRLPVLVKGLIGNGAKARHINRMITTVSDAVLKKVMGFVLQEMGPPPLDFVFMVLGSEGRGEQTLKTDQDNAIVFEDVPAEELPKAREYFLELGQKACTMLDQAGYTFCRGEVMAQNPKWCQPLSVWKKYFLQWINAAEPENLLQASIFFDFRCGYGSQRLVDALRGHLNKAIGNWSGFLRHMAENALYFRPPLGFFRNFVVESKGEHRNAFDIKSAMMPIVDFARVYALKHSIEPTNTLDRLQHLSTNKKITQEECEELDKAYSFLMQLRFVRQVTATTEQKGPPDNFINPKRLTRIEQTMLKEIFKRIEKFQAKMSFDFIGLA